MLTGLYSGCVAQFFFLPEVYISKRFQGVLVRIHSNIRKEALQKKKCRFLGLAWNLGIVASRDWETNDIFSKQAKFFLHFCSSEMSSDSSCMQRDEFSQLPKKLGPLWINNLWQSQPTLFTALRLSRDTSPLLGNTLLPEQPAAVDSMAGSA